MVEQNNQKPDSKNYVNNSVINALLEAIFDILDYNGKSSILTLSGRLDLLKEKLPQGTSKSSEFLKIINSMRTLLEFSSKILFEIGKKFSIYLDPYGSSILEFIEILNNSFVDPSFNLQKNSKNNLSLSIVTQNNNTDLLTDPWLRYFYEGIFLEGVRKAIGGKVQIEFVECDKFSCSFNIETEYNYD
jgi:hypothetical protein